GSAHCTLGPWWSDRLGKSMLTGRQISTRGGRVQVTVDGTTVRLGGHAATSMTGEIPGPNPPKGGR
ncbi:MAG: hypothetical protein R3336_07185, partial [Phycisphaeraceae bacterium]|nr:hypothetical protein [Phycisphaeraceae bacterium]